MTRRPGVGILGPVVRCLLLLFVSGAAACSGQIVDAPTGSGVPPTDRPFDPTETPTREACAEQAPTVGLAPMRRLTSRQVANSIEDILGVEADVTRFNDTESAGFFANTQPVDAYQVEEYLDVAESVTAAAIALHRDRWFACDAASTDCVRPWIASTGRRLFRRTVDEAVLAELVDLYERSRTAWGPDEAIARVLETMLISPYFLYLVEREPDAPAGTTVPLDPYELASRLSYFLWDSAPDETLLDAAEAGELGRPEMLEAQARRMLENAAAVERAVESFHVQWLALDDPRVDLKDPDAFGFYTPETAASMRHEALAFVTDMFQSGGSLEMLLTANHTFVDARLAALYGVDAPAGPDFERVELDPAERAGILTMPRFLASHAHFDKPSWVLRGLFVREALLCQSLPDPPADAPMDTTNDPDRTVDPNCSTCHLRLDPVGQGFDQYDAAGLFRTTTADGDPIEATGRVVDADLADEGFEGVPALAQALAESPTVRSCVARHWLRFATAALETRADGCTVRSVEDRFTESGYDLRELLVAVVASDAFRTRRVSEEVSP